MTPPLLHLPVDWERKAPVARLARRMAQSGFAEWSIFAPLYFVRMWTEWASNPEEWRPLCAHVAEVSAHDWAKEDLCYIIAMACGWPADGGAGLLRCAIEAGVYEIQARGEISGLVLADWWRYNEHLSPDYRSMQSKGGAATRLTNAAKMAAHMAEQQALIWSQQGNLMLAEQSESADEQRAALALVIQLDRHCGNAVRLTAGYGSAILHDAVAVVRKHLQPAIDRVLIYLSENRSNAQVVKVPERVLERFDEYLAAASKEEMK